MGYIAKYLCCLIQTNMCNLFSGGCAGKKYKKLNCKCICYRSICEVYMLMSVLRGHFLFSRDHGITFSLSWHKNYESSTRVQHYKKNKRYYGHDFAPMLQATQALFLYIVSNSECNGHSYISINCLLWSISCQWIYFLV